MVVVVVNTTAGLVERQQMHHMDTDRGHSLPSICLAVEDYARVTSHNSSNLYVHWGIICDMLYRPTCHLFS